MTNHILYFYRANKEVLVKADRKLGENIQTLILYIQLIMDIFPNTLK